MIKKLLFELFITIAKVCIDVLAYPARLNWHIKGEKYKKENPNGTIKLLDEYQDFDYQKLNNQNIVLFSAYKPQSALMYERYFDLLDKLNHKIVLISNSPLPQWFVDKFKDRVLCMATRYNIGRDFGVYKEFIVKILKEKIKPSSLIICNDSIYANLQKDNNVFVDWFNVQMSEDFVGVCEHYGKPEYHVQSYFLRFSHKVLEAENFQKFWYEFFVSDDRHDNIHKGECKLTQSILLDGFRPKVFITADKCLANARGITVDDLFKVMSFKIANRINNSNNINNSHNNNTNNMLSVLIDLIAKSGMQTFAPIFLITGLSFPFLKRDICVRNYHELSQLGLITDLVDKDLISEFIDEQRIRQRTWNEKNLYRKLLFYFGYI